MTQLTALIPTNGPPRSILSRASYTLATITITLLAAGLAVGLTSLTNPSRLVPIAPGAAAQALVWAGVLAIAGALLVRRLVSVPDAVAWFGVAFALRVLAVLLLTLLLLYDDERAFHLVGMGRPYGLLSFEAGTAYYQLVPLLYAAFGPNILLPKMVNALLGALLPFFAFDLGRWWFGSRQAGWRAFLMTAFLPPLVVYSAVNLKEILTTFLFVFAAWLLSKPDWRLGWKAMGVGLCLGMMYWNRDMPWALALGTGVGTCVLASKPWHLGRRFKLGGWPRALLVLAGGLLFAGPFIAARLVNVMDARAYLTPKFIASQATVMRFVDASNPLSVWNFTVLLVRGLFSPSPLRFLADTNLSAVVEALSTWTWYLTIPLFAIGLLAGRRQTGVLAAGMTVFGILALVTFGQILGSDPYRHRTAALGLMFVLAAGGLEGSALRRYRWVACLWWLAAAGFTILWAYHRA